MLKREENKQPVGEWKREARVRGENEKVRERGRNEKREQREKRNEWNAIRDARYSTWTGTMINWIGVENQVQLRDLRSSSSISLHSSSSDRWPWSTGSRNVAGAKPCSPLEFATSHQPEITVWKKKQLISGTKIWQFHSKFRAGDSV